MFTNIGLPQLLIILLIVLVLFGARRLPQLGDNLGKAIRNFRGSLAGEEKEEGKDNKKTGE
jgi:sec-independent protein translocase protein TatA